MTKLLTLPGAIALSATMFAAGLTGKWTGKVESPNGTRDVNMTFKATAIQTVGGGSAEVQEYGAVPEGGMRAMWVAEVGRVRVERDRGSERGMSEG